MDGIQETNVYAFSGLSNGEYDNLNADTINTDLLYIKGVLFDASGEDLSNYVTTTQLSTQLIPINNNISDISNNVNILKVKTTNISYNPINNTTSFLGLLSFPNNSINSNSINNTSFVTISGVQSISSIKTFLDPPIFSGANITNGSIPTAKITGTAINSSSNQSIIATKIFTVQQNFSSIRLDGSLLVGLSGAIVINNSTLQKINFLSNVTYDINSKFNDYVLTSALTSTLLNYVTSSFLTTTLSGYVSTSYLSSQLLNYVTNTNLSTQLLNYVSISGLTLTLSDYIKKSDLNLQLSNYALNSALDTTNNNVTTLQNKLQQVTYDVPTEYFDIYKNCHIYGVLKLGAILNVEGVIDGLGISVGIAGGAAAKATTDILTINNITIPAMNIVSANLSLRIDALETKTTNMTYNLALNTTYIAATLSLTTVRLNSLDSGILQTANQSVVFIGETEIRNDFSVTNGFGMSCDGGIIQNNNSANTFRGSLTVNNNFQCDDFTSGGTNANINSTNTNINSTTCNITGNTIIKNMSEISLGTIAPYLSILSTKLNTNNRKLQGLVIGKEQLVANEECNCNVGFNYAFGGFENYGYLGLNVNTTDTRESFRWFETGCSLPTGDLTVSTGGIIISSGDIKTNTINNRSQNLNINSAYTLNLNSDTINIGTSQSTVPPAFNSINIGNVASLSIINLNGLVYSPYQMNITGAISQW